MNCNLAANLKSMNKSILLIGYGNDLRSDDGVGQKIAHTVHHWNVPHLTTLAVHQLTPELAAGLAEVDFAIFVDANYQETSEVKVDKVEINHNIMTSTHHSDPESLLSLAENLYHHHPETWLVKIPAVNFEIGENLSSVTENAMNDALEEIDFLIRKCTK
ncbi:MAG TPA: hydrogenase maturation protease [Allocoleopsis sp.]